MCRLTEEQRAEVRSLITEMREAGASREEIHASVSEMLEGFGVEVPERAGHRAHRRHRLMAELSEEQRQEIHGLVRQMHEAGASREEIRAAVREKLREMGIDLPDRESAGALQSGGGPERSQKEWGEIKGEYR
jgi:DNA-binding transcriptional MerR regulator